MKTATGVEPANRNPGRFRLVPESLSLLRRNAGGAAHELRVIRPRGMQTRGLAELSEVESASLDGRKRIQYS
jgi:hypothetical protein